LGASIVAVIIVAVFHAEIMANHALILLFFFFFFFFSF